MIPGDIPLPIVLAWLFVFGSVVGSFLNVCIYRIPTHEKLWDQLSGLNHPPSTCPFCKKRILAIDNVPILGWIWLRGRCRFCRHSIPIRYALIELLNGLLWVVLYVAIVPAGYHARIESSVLYSHLGALAQPNLGLSDMVWLANAEYFYFLILAEALLVATFIDFDTMTIPDGVTVPGMIAGLFGGWILGTPTLWPVWFFSRQELNGMQSVLPGYLQWMLTLPENVPWLAAHPHWHGLANSLLGLIVGGGVVALVRLLANYAFGKEAMGDGDVTLMAMVGSFLGWQQSLVVFFMLAPIFALISIAIRFLIRFMVALFVPPLELSHQSFLVRMVKTFPVALRLGRQIPFGPYLSGGAIVVVLFWKSWFSHFDIFFSRGPFLLLVFILMAAIFFPLLILIRFVLGLIRYALGIEDDDFDEYEEQWTSGDQLQFYANKEERQFRAPMEPSVWPGIASGQGRLFYDRWRGSR